MKFIIFLILSLVVIGGVTKAFFRQQTLSSAPAIQKISLCQLTKEWKTYNHSTVRIDAIYRAELEASEVYDPACPASEHAAWVPSIPVGSSSPAPPGLAGELDKLLKKDRRARITVLGEFDGPPAIDVPAGLSPEAAAVFRNGGSRYGHQNRWDFQFVFSKIESVEPVPAHVSWPHASTDKRE
jgi:hypothetical protein